MDAGRLYDRLTAILSAIEAGFTAAGVTLPDQRYTHVGEVAYDCPEGQLTVAASGLFLGQPGQRGVPAKNIGPRGAVITVHLTRCITAILTEAAGTPILPTEAQFTSDAEQQATDGTVLFDVVLAAWRDGTLFGDCDGLVANSMTPYGPDGLVAGWTLQLEVSMG